MKKSNYQIKWFKNPLKAVALFAALAFASITVNAQYDLKWVNPSTGVNVSGNTITTTGGGPWSPYSIGAESANKLPSCSDGWVEFTINTTGVRAVGLSENCSWDMFVYPAGISFGFNFDGTGQYRYIINGAFVGGLVPYSPGDVFKVERIGTGIYFTVNGTGSGSPYTITNPITTDWCVTAALSPSGSSMDVSNAIVSFGIPSDVSCDADFWARNEADESIYTFNPNDNVGIGTMTPSERLDVNGTIRARNVAQDNSLTKFAVLDANGVMKYRDNLTSFGGWYKQGTTTVPTAITDNIYTEGNIGVGVTSPSKAIDVYGREVNLRLRDNNGAGFASSPGVILENSNGLWNLSGPRSYETKNNFGIWWNNGPWKRCFSVTDDARFLMADNSNPSIIGTYRLYVNGDAYINGTWTSSDKRLKNNIDKISGSLDIISKISGYKYNYNELPDSVISLPKGRQYGVLAQELKEIMPEAVKLNNNGYYAVNYDMLIPVLLEGVKEQQTTIEKQNAKIEKLEQDMEEIKNLLKQQGSLPKTMESNVANYISIRPNPTFGKTAVDYSITEAYTTAKLIVYNELGQKVAEYEVAQKGNGSVDVDATGFKGGTYFCNLVVDGNIKEVKKFIVAKY